MYKIYYYLLKVSSAKLVLISFIARIVVSLMTAAGVYCLQRYSGIVLADNQPLITKYGLTTQFVFAIIMAPLLETFLFQYVLINGFLYYVKISHRNLFAALVSSILFGLQHYYSAVYIINTFLIGLVLAYTYLFAIHSGKRAFWIVATVHCLSNLFSFLLRI